MIALGMVIWMECSGLMHYWADINAKNHEGETPLDVARGDDIKQAIRDVEQQRYEANFGKKCIPEADLRPPPPPTTSVEEDGEADEDDESSGDDEEVEDDDEDVDRN